MQHLKLNNLSFKYLHDEIFTNLNLDFSTSWCGVVGQNGSGKTTLLKLIAKKLKPTNGNISGNDLVYYCDQKLDLFPFGFEEFRDDFSSKRYKIQELLGIKDQWLYIWDYLSFGEKKRIQLAIALYSEADILLLDEPTNHLDYSSKKRVIKALQSFKKIGLIVSHDREVLDSLCNSTLIIKNKNFYKYKTKYTNAIRQFKKELIFLAKEHKKQNQKQKVIKRDIQSQKEKVSKIKSKLSKKNIDKKDKSAKEKINLAKLTGKDKVDSKRVDTLKSKLQQIDSKQVKIDKEYKKGIFLENSNSKNNIFPIVLKANKLKLDENKQLIFPEFTINDKDKIAIMGDNGSGKSSFIKYLLSIIDKKEVFYLPQEINELETKNLFSTINYLDDKKKGELFTFVTRLSSNPKALIDNINPSPGELKKLLIAKAMLEGISLIILDEPTNHMDIESIISLEKALHEYNGSVILISHDKWFLQNIVSKVWYIFDNQLKLQN